MASSKAAARDFVFSQLDFFLMTQFRKSKGHFNSKRGGNYVVDIVHIDYIYIYIYLFLLIFLFNKVQD
jgi:transcriptional regulator CtsR